MVSENSKNSGANAPENIKSENSQKPSRPGSDVESEKVKETALTPTEIGGRGGADPTRYGDWEINGRCVDF
ncbi:MAG: hypothetical protein CFH41_01296 [Alphaproteobacteria bacterium MarineAlpha11_Bin1]|nr:MAG: hypothetical protein CFH41_01296 [Alphaproteobacteria bacterium MarineAlpha11_Bin1]|tara:strand:+ start:588 stop:800 length:213 start_codon:yes stop_codon:yes gene_type:complete